jgi:hypothetical protein
MNSRSLFQVVNEAMISRFDDARETAMVEMWQDLYPSDHRPEKSPLGIWRKENLTSTLCRQVFGWLVGEAILGLIR